MAINVHVKGDKNGDYIFTVFEAKFTRKLDTEILQLVDQNQILLFEVPFEQVRYMQLVPTKEEDLIKFAGPNRQIVVHVVGEPEDISLIGHQVSYERPINNQTLELKVFMDFNEQKQPIFALQNVLPLENVRYIDYNFVIEGQKTEENNQPKNQNNNTANNKIKLRNKN